MGLYACYGSPQFSNPILPPFHQLDPYLPENHLSFWNDFNPSYPVAPHSLSNEANEYFCQEDSAQFSHYFPGLPYISVPENSERDPIDCYYFEDHQPKRPRTTDECFTADSLQTIPLNSAGNPLYEDYWVMPDLLPTFRSPNVLPVCPSHQNPDAETVTLSPQSIAARQRRRRISEKTQDLGRLVPGGAKMNTAQMLAAAAKYVKFLQAQVRILEFLKHSIPEQEEEEGFSTRCSCCMVFSHLQQCKRNYMKKKSVCCH